MVNDDEEVDGIGCGIFTTTDWLVVAVEIDVSSVEVSDAGSWKRTLFFFLCWRCKSYWLKHDILLILVVNYLGNSVAVELEEAVIAGRCFNIDLMSGLSDDTCTCEVPRCIGSISNAPEVTVALHWFLFLAGSFIIAILKINKLIIK